MDTYGWELGTPMGAVVAYGTVAADTDEEATRKALELAGAREATEEEAEEALSLTVRQEGRSRGLHGKNWTSYEPTVTDVVMA